MDEDTPPAPTVPASVVAAAVNGPVQVISAKRNIQTHLAMHPGFLNTAPEAFNDPVLIWLLASHRRSRKPAAAAHIPLQSSVSPAAHPLRTCFEMPHACSSRRSHQSRTQRAGHRSRRSRLCTLFALL